MTGPLGWSGTARRDGTGALTDNAGDEIPFTWAKDGETLAIKGAPGHGHWAGTLGPAQGGVRPFHMGNTLGFQLYGHATFTGGAYAIEVSSYVMPDWLLLPGEEAQRVAA